MKLSERWLREWVSPRVPAGVLAERLTLAGIEVGAIESVAPSLDKVVVGKIVSVTPHPTADKLTVCRVQIGKREPLTIVSGAANASAGAQVPVALVGAVLPNGTTVRRAEIRGVTSDGLLCSEQELGLVESSDGLLILDDAHKPGTSLSTALALDDVTLEMELTPNRGDCLSVAGMAREVAAITGASIHPLTIRPVKARHRQRRTVVLAAPKDCARYVGRIVSGINPRAVTPSWLRERLRRSGLRSIHPVVDVTNYVMLELGQPMHAFDHAKIDGAVRVRQAGKNESLVLLDGNRATLNPGCLLIADDRRPLALAGIMGGQDSAVDESTTDVFLESAWFRPETISVWAREFGLQTESSFRFERGVDPTLQAQAIERATALLCQVAGGRPGPIIERINRKHLPKVNVVLLRKDRLERLLGLVLPNSDVKRLLQRLNMSPKRSGKQWRVTPPSWRFDIVREEDLIEEIARLYGYDRLPSRRPRMEMTAVSLPESKIGESRLRSALIDRDYQEVVTYSFVDPKFQSLIDPDTNPARLTNPISADMSVMRTSLWPGLLQAILYNQNRQQTRVRLFEIGRIFLPRNGQYQEKPVLAGAACGEALSEQWGVSRRIVDFHDVKADVEALLTLAGLGRIIQFRPGQHMALHPGQSAEVLTDKKCIGHVGVVHPATQARIGLDRPVIVFELSMEALQSGKIPIFSEFSRFPAIRRDLAILVEDSTPAQSVLDCVSQVAGERLVNLELFDEYRGKGIDSGRKSLALGLTLQDSSRTLNEDDVERVMNAVMSALVSRLGAEPRQ